ncbi:hypothetical protein XM38_031320 [Halomicronema hongdechloris C2206]|uniref:Uncharacterized protein n=1 Tax=Halomicronema hongdechloris C2206 TaxID=1641165 RepID=A0A1Z3HPE9_9CYAN|nr:hypothetical protein [Halomicronema hongdechloris]ASC72178.1 hypothetical protein XM38_031320 [Halomicronema hongdechloris C2206]
MKTSASESLMTSLQEAIRLAQDVHQHSQAHEAFEAIYGELEAINPDLAEMMQMLWKDYVAAQRSASFWQELCQVEKHLSERIAESHLQLKQNYLRLMREQ